MPRIYLSLPMSGKSEFEIKRKIQIMTEKVNKLDFNGAEVVIDNNFEREHLIDEMLNDNNISLKDPALAYLGCAISSMAECDFIFFAQDWKDARGCRIEYQVAKEYGIDMLFETEDGIDFIGGGY